MELRLLLIPLLSVISLVPSTHCFQSYTIGASKVFSSKRHSPPTNGSTGRTICIYNSLTNDSNDDENNRTIPQEAEELLLKAKKIRSSLEENKPKVLQKKKNNNTSLLSSGTKPNSINPSRTKFNIQPRDHNDQSTSVSVEYRLYLDIGREQGTWMDPRWGASGKRIESTIDVSFILPPPSSKDTSDDDIDHSQANDEIIKNMVKDNLSGRSSAVRILNSAPFARLRNGFDEMKTYGGGYRIDISDQVSSSNTVRFYLSVDGTEGNSSYGDINIPRGNLYFSLPCFGNDVTSLSSKEGIVTVRQFGWHTGWRREESRIVGVFRAVPMVKAVRMDGF